jgi:ABC-type multidrug transport system fused ATPase/permease subunit
VTSASSTPRARGLAARIRKFDAVPAIDRSALRRFSAPAAGFVRVATVAQVVASALSVAPMYGIWMIADAAWAAHQDGSDPTTAVWWGIGLVAVSAVLGFLLTSGAYWATHVADLRVRRTVRTSVAEHLSRLPLGWFDSDSSEKALAALGPDVEALHTAVAHGRLELIQSFVAPVVAVVWLVTVDWRLTVIVLVPTALHYFLQQGIIKRANDFYAEQGAAVMGLVSSANEQLRDAVTHRIAARATSGASTLLTASRRLHTVIVDSHLEQESRGSRISSLVDPVFGLFVVFLGGFLLFHESTPPTDLIPFVVATVLISSAPAAVTISRWGIVQAAMGADRIAELLQTPPLPFAENPTAPVHHGIEMDAVTFGYGDDPVLREVTLDIADGSFTAVVGPSGSGKSTLASLLCRHYDVGTGAVRVGGVDVREIDPRTLHRTVGLLPQRAVMLRTTLRDNIRLARPDASESVVVAAAVTAQIHEKIMSLPLGYDTVVGDDLDLSSGEKQRVALARALVTDPSVLILDEPTAHVDPESAAAIHAALAEVVQGRTTVLIAHRLETVVDADRIVVVESGGVSAVGTHAELSAKDGVYKRMWDAVTEEAVIGSSQPEGVDA